MSTVAVTGFGWELAPLLDGRSDAEILAPAVEQALGRAGILASEVDIVCSAGSEFLGGVIGGVMGAFDAFPGWPPRSHSHLEGDGAFALYEAWIRLLAGEGRTALVCAFGRPSADDPRAVLSLQDDPVSVGPLSAHPIELAALQARALVDSGRCSEAAFAEIAAARREVPLSEILAMPYAATPLRRGDCSDVCGGAAAVVLTVDSAHAGPRIAGMGQQYETSALGARDLTVSVSTAALAGRLGVSGGGLDVMELHAPYSHQEIILTEAIAAAGAPVVNPSGGALVADPLMVTGLLRICHAAEAISSGRASRALAHATNGACLQHNLVCLLVAS